MALSSASAATGRLRRRSDRALAAEQASHSGDDDRAHLINRADGTLLNGEALAREARRPLSDGDTISVGPYTISFQTGNGFRPGATLTEPLANSDEAGGGRLRDTRETPAPPPAAAPQVPTAPAAQGTSFAAILDSLRTEEDTFYFQVETATAGRLRVPVTGALMLLGWDRTGRNVACGDGGGRTSGPPSTRIGAGRDSAEETGAASVNGEPARRRAAWQRRPRDAQAPVGLGGHRPGRNFYFYDRSRSSCSTRCCPRSNSRPCGPAAPDAEAAGRARVVPAPRRPRRPAGPVP